MSQPDIEAAISTYLKASALNAAATVNGRIYCGSAPQTDPATGAPTAFPRITFAVISDIPEHDMDGAAGIGNALVQIDVWAITSPNRRTIANAVKNAMDGIIGGTMGGLNVGCVLMKNERNTEEKPENASEANLFRASMDFEIWKTEDIPTLT